MADATKMGEYVEPDGLPVQGGPPWATYNNVRPMNSPGRNVVFSGWDMICGRALGPTLHC